MADRFPIILNTSANQLQELASGDTLDVSGAAIKSNLVDSLSVVGTGVSIVGVVTATSFVGSGAALTGIDITALKDSGGNVKVQAEASGAVYTGIHTFGSTTSFTSGVFNGTVTSTGAVVNGDIDLNGDIDVDGHTNLDNVSIAGVTTTTENINIDADNKRLQIGDGQDLKLYHDGNHSYIDNDTGHLTVTASQINLNNQDNSENCATFAGNGAVNLFYNGNAKLQTATSGVNVSGTTTTTGLSVTGVSTFTGNIDANGDLDLNGDLDVDGHTNLDNVNVAGVTTFAGAINGSSAAFTGDLSVAGTLTYEDVKNVDSVGVATARTGLKVLAGGANVVGVVTASNGIFVPDSQTIHVGGSSGSGDLQIYHDTSNSYIKDNGTGDLLLQTQAGYVKIRYGTDTMALFQPSNKAELYYANSAKLATSNTGVTITGAATATTFIGALTGTASGNTTISNNADNRVVTGGSGNALNGESGLTYDGNQLTVTGATSGTTTSLNVTAGGGPQDIFTVGKDGIDTKVKIGGVQNCHTDLFLESHSTEHNNIHFGHSGAVSKGQIKFHTNNNYMAFHTGSTERLRIDGTGDILIGTLLSNVNPHGRVNIFGTDGDTACVAIRRGSNDASGARLSFYKSRNTTDGSHTVVQSGDTIGTIHFYANDSQGPEEGASIAAVLDGTPGSNDVPTKLVFSTTPDGSDTKQIRMTIKNTGRVGINESDPSEMLYVAGNIYATGNVTAYSDIRVKENVKEISNALEAVDKIRGVSYTRKDTKEDTLGVSAQEVETMFPELVVEDNHGMKSVNYNGLVGVLFSAVKELSTKLKEIEDK